MPRMLLILLLVAALPWNDCDTQISRDEASLPPDGPGADGSAFFALRSCHQLLTADRGEFLSPDYLCSNPPLWCNWTIQVDPGKRIHLDMEDLTPDDSCHLKRDQIHVDEPAGRSAGHRILQRCWREAKYTSSSNTLQVVLLIGGWPSPPYRGFYGRYQAFGPPVVYNPQQGFAEQLVDFSDTGPVLEGEHTESDLPPEGSDDELPLEAEEAADTEVWDGSPVDPLTAVPTVPASTHRTSRSGRGASKAVLSHSAMHAIHELKSEVYSPTAGQKDVREAAERADETNTQSWRAETSAGGSEPAARRGNRSEVLQQKETEETEQAQPGTVELLSDPRGNPSVNHSVNPHLPGDFLFEVAVEVDFNQDSEDSWDNQARSLLLSVKSLVREKLEAVRPLLTMSSKRIKRLNAGVLYILWLRIGPSPGLQVHSSVRSALQGLVASGLRDDREAVVMSVSTADVNECGTQLVLCDANADCVNHFGSYSCHCRPGFRDESRLGSGGTVCVDVRGCSSGLAPEAKGVYVLFFLLSSFVLMLLVVAGVLYRRHHRGAFMVHCHSGSSMCPADLNNNNNNHRHPQREEEDYSYPAETHRPPPLPPARGPRGGWPQGKQRCPAVDLPLLRFSSLRPSDGYVETQDSGRM